MNYINLLFHQIFCSHNQHYLEGIPIPHRSNTCIQMNEELIPPRALGESTDAFEVKVVKYH